MYRRRGILLYIAGEGDILLYIAGEGDILLCIAGEGDIPLCIAGEGDILLCIAGLSLPRLPEELVPGRSPPAVVRVFRVWDARATGVGWRPSCCSQWPTLAATCSCEGGGLYSIAGLLFEYDYLRVPVPMPAPGTSSGSPAGDLPPRALHSRQRYSHTRAHPYNHAIFRVPARYVEATGMLDTWMDRGAEEKAP